jgi:hypothetical protein
MIIYKNDIIYLVISKIFIYSLLFLLYGMPDIDNIGADLLASGKG